MAISFSLVEAAAGAAIVPAGATYQATGSVVAAAGTYVGSFIVAVFGVGAYHIVRSLAPTFLSAFNSASQ